MGLKQKIAEYFSAKDPKNLSLVWVHGMFRDWKELWQRWKIKTSTHAEGWCNDAWNSHQHSAKVLRNMWKSWRRLWARFNRCWIYVVVQLLFIRLRNYVQSGNRCDVEMYKRVHNTLFVMASSSIDKEGNKKPFASLLLQRISKQPLLYFEVFFQWKEQNKNNRANTRQSRENISFYDRDMTLEVLSKHLHTWRRALKA